MKVMRILHRKEKERRTILIERCGQCPYISPMYELGQDRTFACYNPWLSRYKVDMSERIVEIDGYPPEWCPEQDKKEIV